MNKIIELPIIDLQVEAEMRVHTLHSTIDGLKRIAALSPNAVRSTAYFLALAADELAEFSAKIGERE